MLASITHAYEFGTVAFVAGAVVIAILFALSSHYRRTGNRPVLVLYGLLNLWVIGGFGLVGGLWNHAVKVAVSAATGGALPQSLERFFMSPNLGGATHEIIGILTFGASLFAVYFGYRYARTLRWMRRADAPGRSTVRSSPRREHLGSPATLA
jgi:hypothetical protein